MEITDTRTMTVEYVPLAALVPSPFNPRGKHSRDPEQLKELAADIAVHGVQQAILVRPDGAGKYEIVFGTRRAEASKMAGRETIPAVVRELSAEEALTLAMVENLQRTDIHFMDEAAGFKKLLSGGVAPKTVGEMVGKPEVYVHLRMALNNLNPKWTAEAYKGTLLLGSALMLARLTTGAQIAAWREMHQYGMNEDGNFGAAAIRRFLDRNVMTVLSKAPFPTDSADLIPAAGTCTICPKRSGASPMLFPDIKETDTCTDAECYGNKCRAYLELRKKELPGAVEIASTGGLAYNDRDRLAKKKVILPRQEYGRGGWTESFKDACEHTKEGIIVAGDGMGKSKYVCAEEGCKVHGSRRSAGGRVVNRTPGIMNEERKRQVEQLWQRRTDKAVRMVVHAAVRAGQAKAKDAFASIPLEAFRFIVKECAYALRPQQDGVKYFEDFWPLPKGAKASDDYRSGLDKLMAAAPDRPTLLRILSDLTVAQDVAAKFSDGEKIEELAKAYLVPIKKVSAPVEKEWNEKKRLSYEKRDKRLAGERASVKKKAGAGKKGKMLKATEAKLKDQAGRLAADQKKIDGEVERIKARTMGNMCRHCGCTEARACLVDGVPCSWIVKPKKVKGEMIAGVCSNPECMTKESQAGSALVKVTYEPQSEEV